jgi:L-fuconolactonase
MTVIDAHHHFWDPGRAEYPWLTEDLAPIRRPFGPADLRPLLVASGIDRTVLVQTRSSLDETREFLATAAAEPFIAAVVGWVDLTSPDVANQIEELRAGTGGSALRAIRHQAQDEPDPSWLERHDVARGLHAVRSAGLAYDLLVRAREIPAALSAAAALPDLQFVLDHAAKPPIASGSIEAWASAIARFGALPNVVCKLSGLVTEANWSSWSKADLRPVVDVALETFGAERLLFGSDWPVCLLAAPYGQVVATARELLAGLSARERAQVFGDNAACAYSLGPTASSG